MSILQMSFSASVLILIIITIRALAINNLPKKTFSALWAVALLRLLIPISFPSPLSVYSFINNTMVAEKIAGIPAVDIFPTAQAQVQSENIIADAISAGNYILIPSMWTIVWIIGIVLCALYFVMAYIKFYREFQKSIYVENDFVVNWLNKHKILRPISIKQSDNILSPLTYGIFRPVILIPKNMDWSNVKQLQYILAHEFIHIWRLDTVAKLFLTAALCIHWFNPFVWTMYILSNRDIELSCDESVVHSFGEVAKSSYARILISMEEEKSTFASYYNGFSKNAIEERIVAIMKIKKTSFITVLISGTLITGVTTVFATSATVENDINAKVIKSSFAENNGSTDLNGNLLSEIKIGDSLFIKDNSEIVSDTKKVSFDIETVKVDENVMLGGYKLQKGDTVQVEYENIGIKINIFIFSESITKSDITKISTAMPYEIPKDGDYYVSIQTDTENGIIENVKGALYLKYQEPQIVQDERIQFTDDETYNNESQSTDNMGASDNHGATNSIETSTNKDSTSNNKSSYDAIFDNNSTVLEYYVKNSYTANDYQETIIVNEASLAFVNFVGSKVIYELNFNQATTIDFRISADVDGEYKVVFITEDNEIVMKASSYNWFPASRPIEIPKGKTIVVLVGEQATGDCNIALKY